MLRTMEGIKGDGFAIEEYSINETTLGMINMFISAIKISLYADLAKNF